MIAAEDFLLLVLHAHTISAARLILQFMDVPTVSELADKILVNYVLLLSLKLVHLHHQMMAFSFMQLKFSPFH